MATLPALNYVSNSARTQGEVKTALEDTNTFIRTLFGSNTDTATMPIANNSIPPSKLANGGAELGPRNRIINGAMAIDQQYVGAATSVQGYCLDQWAFGSSTGTLTAQRTGSVGNYSLTITATTASTSVNVYQRIESFNIADLAGKTVTVSFTASSNTITTLPWSIVYANALDNFATATVSNTGSITINSTPARYSFTTTLPAQAVNGIALNISGGVSMAAGNTLVITNVQLEEGSVATPFERRQYGQELSLCQRYYQIRSTQFGGASASGVGFYWSDTLPVPMRASPTAVLTNTIYTGGTNTLSCSASASVASFSANNSAASGIVSSNYSLNARL